MSTTPLRKRMLDQMTLRNMAPKTKESYVWAVAGLAKFHKQSPDKLTAENVQEYLLYLHNNRKLAWSTCNVAYSGLRFFYEKVIRKPDITFSIPPRRGQRQLPNILSMEEVKLILDAAGNLKHRALLMTAYGAGLRVGEVVHLTVKDIQGSRKAIRVRQGKGNKDRYTLLPDRLLTQLREYCRSYRPMTWLFFGHDKNNPMNISTAQRAYYRAKEKAGIMKDGGIHTLRHCFATHLLEAGYDIFTIKRVMGHGALSTTMRYLRMTPTRLEAIRSPLDTAKFD